MKAVQVVYKTRPRFPSQLEHFVFDDGNSFAEKLRTQINMLNYGPSFETHLAKRRLAISTSALIQEAVAIRETLGVGSRVVGKHSNDGKGVLWRCRRRNLSYQKRTASGQKKQNDKPREDSLHPV